jgi:hypothetical protein
MARLARRFARGFSALSLAGCGALTTADGSGALDGRLRDAVSRAVGMNQPIHHSDRAGGRRRRVDLQHGQRHAGAVNLSVAQQRHQGANRIAVRHGIVVTEGDVHVADDPIGDRHRFSGVCHQRAC